MKRPFALIGFTYLLTLAAAVYFGEVISLVFGSLCLAGMGVALAVPRLRKAGVIPAALLVAAFALGRFSFAASSVNPMVNMLDGQSGVVTGRVCELPYRQNNRFYYVIEVEQIKLPSGQRIAGDTVGKVRISTQNALEIDLYDTLEGSVGLYAPSGGEDGFSSRSYYASKEIPLFGFLYEYGGVSIVPAKSKPPYYYALRLRQWMLDSLQAMVPKQEAALLSGTLLGEKHALDEGIKADFSTVGLSHVLAVSGLHLSILTQLFLLLLGFCRVPKRIAAGVTAAGVLCFMAMTGFVPSVMRSGIMLLLYLGGLLVRRRADSCNSLGFAVFLLCLFHPYAAADTGLLLSFFSTLGILTISPRIERCFRRKIYPAGLQKGSRPGRRLLMGSASVLSATLGALLFSTPVTVLSFGRVSLLAPLSNLLLVLPCTLMIQTSFLAALLYPVPGFSFLAMPLSLAAGFLAKGVRWATHGLAQIPFASIPAGFGFVGLWLAASLFLLGLAVLLFRRKLPLRTLSLLSVSLLLVGILSYQLRTQSVTRIAVLDAGTGAAVVVTGQGRAAVVGCGGYRAWPVQKYLQAQGIARLDYLQLQDSTEETGRHAARLLKAFPADTVLLPADTYAGSALEQALMHAGRICYFEQQAAALWGGITVEKHGEDSSVKITADGISVVLTDGTSDPSRWTPAWQQADVVVASGIPQNSRYLRPFFTILSMERDAVTPQQSDGLLREEGVYLTGGQGHVIIEISNGRNITLRRES